MNQHFRSILLLFLTSGVLAAEKPQTSYTANAGITFTEGNSDTSQFNLGFEARRVTEETTLSVEATYDYGRSREEQDGDEVEVTNLDKGKFDAKGNRILSDKLYAYLNATVERNEISGLDQRINAGPGIGYYFRRDETMTFSLESGAVWVFEETDGVEDDYGALRIAENLIWEITEGARIRQDFEVVADVSDEENYFFNLRLVAEASLAATLGLRLEVRNEYNNQPGSGKEKNDITLLSGITVTW